ncbi:MAG: class II aldolase/adducin family protein, partial [Bacillota bacterium]|nr:class II aldolase/adducin family protein [Bacillota bacterium]
LQVIETAQSLLRAGLVARRWGNISCRINDHQFVITPSGRSYTDLKSEEIVIVNIINEKHWGSTIPSVEKGLHLDIYKLRPEVNAIIHTHQAEASALSAMECGLPAKYDAAFGGSVRCGAYGFPGSEELRHNIREEFLNGAGNAVLMAHHGAICCGSDLGEAFRCSFILERSCEQHFFAACKRTYGQQWYPTMFVYEKLFEEKGREFPSVIPYLGNADIIDGMPRIYGEIEGGGFSLREDPELTERVFSAIFNARPDIRHIRQLVTPETLTYSALDQDMPTLIDDFAQINGPVMKCAPGDDPEAIVTALGENNGVLLTNGGALCCGNTQEDTAALGLVTEKNAHAALIPTFFPGKIAPAVPIEECEKMRAFYLREYSKRFQSKDKS